MTALVLNSLSKSFQDIKAVDALSFSVYSGEIFGLVGPDGAGKTTTMRMLAGILDPTAGTAQVLNYSLDESEAIKFSIGYMSQRFGLYPDLTVSENIDFYADVYNVSQKERIEKKNRLLEMSNLTPFVYRLANNLSGGMKQKLGLICALIHAPKLVILDEPTNGVDPVSRREFWRILKNLQAQGISILLTTSYLDEAEKCDRIGLMDKGKLLLLGLLDEMRKKQSGKVIEITLKNARKNIEKFQTLFGKDNVRCFGNKIHLIAKEGFDEATLKGIVYESIKEVPYSLEDIFIAEVT